MEPDVELRIFAYNYTMRLRSAIDRVIHGETLRAALDLLLETYASEAHIYVCGNGGSAAIADHLVCDHMKGISSDTTLQPRIHSLCSNTPLLTALANDLHYDFVFEQQIIRMGRPGDLLIAFSCSGKSSNVIRALIAARQVGMKTLAFVGFEGAAGGGCATIADLAIHVEEHNYGICEDAFQAIMHILAQHIRLTGPGAIPQEVRP